jgi:hypothetical protein
MYSLLSDPLYVTYTLLLLVGNLTYLPSLLKKEEVKLLALFSYLFSHLVKELHSIVLSFT